MDGTPLSVSPSDLYARLGTASAPVLIDVRRDEAFAADDRLIIGAFHRSPADVESWLKRLPAGREVGAYCNHGRDVSQGVATALRSAGLKAAYLEGGISGWNDGQLPTRRKLEDVSDKWVTREHPK